jgi:hypothetical protein
MTSSDRASRDLHRFLISSKTDKYWRSYGGFSLASVWSGKPPFIILVTYKMVEIVEISEFL